MNSFESQVVKMVREDMSDEQVLALARAEMDRTFARSVTPALKAEPTPAAKPKRKRVRRAKAKRRSVERLYEATEKVFHAVRIAKRGVAVSHVAEYTKLPIPHVQKAIGQLLAKRRLFKAGERRFTRYATTKAAAVKASKAR